MADTIRGSFPDTTCDDCGTKGTTFCHWGPLVPEGTRADLCGDCWTARNEDWKNGKPPKSLGWGGFPLGNDET